MGRARGTFGELLQGVLHENDLDFLVTLPIERGSVAAYTPDLGRHIRVRPAYKQKSRRLAELLVDRYGLPPGGTLELRSTLEPGKGLASSSADLVAAARAVSGAYGLTLRTDAIESLLRSIEPSDGVMHEGVVAFYHRAVRLRARLGHLPAMTIVGHDQGGAVDTIAFNRIPKPYDAQDKKEYDRLLAALTEAVDAGDLCTVGRISTRSAVLNRRLRPHRDFGEVLRACREVEGLGLVTAHSGTALGILLAEDDPDWPGKARRATQLLGRLPGSVTVHRSHRGRRAG